jgi:hypothetical protein
MSIRGQAWVAIMVLCALVGLRSAVAEPRARIPLAKAKTLVRDHVSSLEDDHSGARVVQVGKVRLGGYTSSARTARRWSATTKWLVPGFSQKSSERITGTVDLRRKMPSGQKRITDSISRWLSAPPPNP